MVDNGEKGPRLPHTRVCTYFFPKFLHKIYLKDPTIAKHNSFATSFKSPFFLNEQNHPDFVAGDTRCQENVMLNRKSFITFESALLKVQYWACTLIVQLKSQRKLSSYFCTIAQSPGWWFSRSYANKRSKPTFLWSQTSCYRYFEPYQ